MAWGASPVASVTAALNGGGTSGAIDSTGADTLFAAVVRLTGDSVTLTDAKSNSYGAPVRTQADTGGGGLVSIDFYRTATPATVGTGHTFSLSGGTFAAVGAVAWAGGATSSIDDQENSAGGGGGATTLAAGSITPGFPNTLVLAAIVCSDGADPSSINGGFTIAVHLAAGGANFGVGIAYLVQTTATAANPTWTLTSGATYAAATIANFKPSAGGGGLSIPVAYHHRQRNFRKTDSGLYVPRRDRVLLARAA
jgi:hypothetical protein